MISGLGHPCSPAQFPYSMLAVASVYVAQLSVGAHSAYSHTLSRHSGYPLEAIQECAQHLAALWHKAPNSSLVAVYKKVGGRWAARALLASPGTCAAS